MEFFSVGVNNVQSVESLEFEFPTRDSGGSFVTFVGPSSSGKSALLRAVHALVNNTSSAAVLLRSGAKQFDVHATTKHGRVAVTRGASLSTYTVDEEKYTKAGTSVPEAAQKALGLTDPDLHLRFQFDRPYLLDATSGQAAAALSRLSHAHILRDAAAKASKVARSKTSEADVLETSLAQARAELEAIGDIEAKGCTVEQINEAVTGIQNMVSGAAQTQSAVRDLQAAQGAHSAAQDALEGIPDVSEQMEAVRSEAAKIQQVSSDIHEVRTYLWLRGQHTPAPLQQITEDIEAVREKISQVSQVTNVLSFLKQIQYEAAQENWRRANQASVEGAHEIEQLRASLEICPTCGQEVA